MLRFRGSVEVAQFLGHQEGNLLVDATGVRGLRVAYEIRLRVRVHKKRPPRCQFLSIDTNFKIKYIDHPNVFERSLL